MRPQLPAQVIVAPDSKGIEANRKQTEMEVIKIFGVPKKILSEDLRS